MRVGARAHAARRCWSTCRQRPPARRGRRDAGGDGRVAVQPRRAARRSSRCASGCARCSPRRSAQRRDPRHARRHRSRSLNAEFGFSLALRQAARRSSASRSELRADRAQLRAVPRPDAGAAPVAAEVHGAVPAHAGVQAARRVRERQRRARAVEQGGLGAGRLAAARAAHAASSAAARRSSASRSPPASSSSASPRSRRRTSALQQFRLRIGELAEALREHAVAAPHARPTPALDAGRPAARRRRRAGRRASSAGLTRRRAIAAERSAPTAPRRSPSASSPGSARTAATRCPGRTRAIPTASGCRRSCCSRRRWRRCSATTSASCSAFPTSRRWPPRRWTTCSRCGAASATTAARATCIAARRSVVDRARRRVPAHAARRWRELPGIGRSTAAAIAAFCFGERVAILDGNVKRVLARVLALRRRPGRARAHERALWDAGDGAAAGARHRGATRRA